MSQHLQDVELESADIGAAETLEPVPEPWSLRRSVARFATPAAKASLWTVFCYGATQLLRLVSNIILSRLLFPEAFGLMTVVNVFAQGLQMFSDIGVGPSIIQHRRGDDARFLDTAWTLQAIRGVAIAACSCILAWPLAYAYDQPQLFLLICVGGSTAAISGFNSMALFTARRHLKLGPVTLLEIGAQACGIAVNCAWAWWSPSVWALMAGAVVTAAVRMVFSHYVAPQHHHRFAWEPQAWHELAGFGRWICVSTVISFLAMQTDRILLSKLVPLETLGVYTVAVTVALLPNVLLSTLMFSVLYPLLCRAQRDADQSLERRLLALRGSMLAFGMLMVLCVGAGADIFYHSLYDSRYYDAIWLTQWLCVVVWMLVLNTTLESTLLALGDSRSASACCFAKFAASTVCSVIGFKVASLGGFVIGMAAGAALGQVAYQIALQGHRIHVRMQDLRFTATFAGVAALAMAAHRLSPLAPLVLLVVVAIAVAAFGRRQLISDMSPSPS